MTTAWFCFLAVMVAMYVVLDGFDLGVGALHLRLAKTDEEREQATAAIGPVWNGNEVWLIASGGILFLAFPAAYAAAFSGLYFGLIIVLWLLVGRGLALELREQIGVDAVFGLVPVEQVIAKRADRIVERDRDVGDLLRRLVQQTEHRPREPHRGFDVRAIREPLQRTLGKVLTE